MNKLLLIYSITLAVAVLLSERFRRSLLSASVLFLGAGVMTAFSAFGPVPVTPGGHLVGAITELALFSVLFTDGMQLAFPELLAAIRLPGRALLVGMPLTMAGTAALAHWLVELPWAQSWLLGAILSPTDPVLISALIGRKGIPRSLRRLLHIESGFNDGLALPVILVLLSGQGDAPVHAWAVVAEVIAGIAIGFIVPRVLLWLEGTSAFGASERYESVLAAAAAILAFAICRVTHANEYLAAFTAGVTLATVRPKVRSAFHQFGDTLSELIKLGALLLFGALLSAEFFRGLSLRAWVFAFAALLFARPLALRLALIHSGLPRVQIWAAGWFGPKGFASVTFSLLVLRSGIPNAADIFHLAALVVATSIVAHSSTDVPAARWFESQTEREPVASA